MTVKPWEYHKGESMSKRTEIFNLQRRIKGVTMPISIKRTRWNRNWLCLCGSDKKYKNCCMHKIDSLTIDDGNEIVESLPEDIQKMIDIHNNAKQQGNKFNDK